MNVGTDEPVGVIDGCGVQVAVKVRLDVRVVDTVAVLVGVLDDDALYEIVAVADAVDVSVVEAVVVLDHVKLDTPLHVLAMFGLDSAHDCDEATQFCVARERERRRVEVSAGGACGVPLVSVRRLSWSENIRYECFCATRFAHSARGAVAGLPVRTC